MELAVAHSPRMSWPDTEGAVDSAVGLLNRVFGCWHREMSLPFTRKDETYRTCVACGARRRFDLDRWTTAGPYYRPECKFTLHPGV